MPTVPGTKSSVALNPQQTLAKIGGLITEIGADTPPEPEPAVEAAPVAAPTEPVPPATPPPADADTEPAPDADDETVHQVVVDHEPQEVTLAELKRSYSSAAHNTQRAQELSAKEKNLEPEIRQRVEQEVQETRLRYIQGLQQLDQALQRMEGEPDWVKLRGETTDADFLKQKADWEAGKAQREQLRRHQEQEMLAAQQQQAKQHVAYLQQEEQKLLAAVPEWKDVTKGKAEIAKLAEFVRTKYGAGEQEVATAFQHSRVILMARDAYRYAELHREPNPAARKQQPIKAARPGTPDRPRPTEKVEKLVAQTKSGRQRDAAKAIEAMLD
jgi:hypothetical protein